MNCYQVLGEKRNVFFGAMHSSSIKALFFSKKVFICFYFFSMKTFVVVLINPSPAEPVYVLPLQTV